MTAEICSAQSPSLPNPWLQKIHDVLASANENQTGGGLVLVRPSFALDTWMDTSDPANRRALSDLLDGAADAAPLWHASTTKLSSVYSEILEHSQWAKSTLNNDQRRQLSSAFQILFSDPAHTTPTSGYKNYISLKKKVDDLQRAWDAAAPADRTATMASDLADAKQNLANDGEPQKYLDALNSVQSLNGPSPSQIRDEWKHRYESSITTDAAGNSFAPSDLGHDYTSTVTSQDWITLVIEQGSDAVPVTGVWGYGSANGALAFSDSQATHVTLSFDYAVVPISRPWFDSSLFADRSWRWTAADNPPISDGVTTGDGPHGTFPYIPSAVVLAKNISITSDISMAEEIALQRGILAGKIVTWGPFLLSGRFFDPKGRMFSPRRSGKTVFIGDVQLVGLLTTALPKSPNPNLQYDW